MATETNEKKAAADARTTMIAAIVGGLVAHLGHTRLTDEAIRNSIGLAGRVIAATPKAG